MRHYVNMAMNAIENNIIAFVAIICILIGVWFFSLRNNNEGLSGKKGKKKEDDEDDDDDDDDDEKNDGDEEDEKDEDDEKDE